MLLLEPLPSNVTACGVVLCDGQSSEDSFPRGAVMVAVSNYLGVGIYTPAEAAGYARLRTQTLNRWLYGDSKGGNVIRPQLADESERIVTFLDFIQALAVRAIRVQYNIPLPKIRAAVDVARNHFKIDHPLARPHKTFVFSDGRRQGHGEIYIDLSESPEDPKQLVQISGKASGNYVLSEVAELFLSAVKFDEHNLAIEYAAHQAFGRSIVMNPKRRFGEPVVEGCGYTAATLAHAVQSEGSIEAAAAAFGVGKEDVSAAVSYFDFLATAA